MNCIALSIGWAALAFVGLVWLPWCFAIVLADFVVQPIIRTLSEGDDMSDAEFLECFAPAIANVRRKLRTDLAAAVDKLLDEQRDFGSEHLFSGRDQVDAKDGWLSCIAQLRTLLRALIPGEQI